MAQWFDLSERVAVVIGATSGLGRAIAVGLKQHGATVVPSGRRQAELESLCNQLGSKLCQTADITIRPSIDALRDAVLQSFGRVDILVNAAGVTFRQSTIGVTEAQWSSAIDTNLNGVLRGCQSFYEPLKHTGRGRILNIGSLGSFLAFHEVAAYCASKAAVNAFSEALMQEVRYDNIRVSCVAPGSVATEFAQGDAAKGADWKVSPEEVAEVVVNLLRHPARSLPSRVELRPTRPPKK